MINRHQLALEDNYLFAEIDRRVAAHQRAHPSARLLRLGIGDVTRPLPFAVVDAMKRAADEMGRRKRFAATARTRATHFCARRFRAITESAGSRSRRSISSSATEPRAISAISPTSSQGPAACSFRIRSTPVYADTNRMVGRPVSGRCPSTTAFESC